MKRRSFIAGSSALALNIWYSPDALPVSKDKMDRIAMGTVLFRYRFNQTKPKEMAEISNELRLTDVPAYYRKRFQIRRLEFWSNHFESLEPAYLKTVRDSISKAGCSLVNVQVDSSYDLASLKEEERLRSLEHVKQWIDAVAFLGSECVRINPGSANGSPEKSMESMKAVNDYARSKKLILLTENHFGIEMNPDLHLKINTAAGPSNIYTLPDFGNYPRDSMYESLEKIIPHAWLISAKAAQFNENMDHVSYDFDRCVKLAEKMGFKGIYSLEQWDGKYQNLDYEKVADWLIAHVKNNIKRIFSRNEKSLSIY